MKQKSTGFWVVLILIALVCIIAFSCVSMYNSMARAHQNVQNSKANIETALQRRGDLIPNLVGTVKGFAAHEQEAINSVTNARAALAGAQGIEELSAADRELSSAISRLMVIVENYPTLKADAVFITLMDELAGSENRISVARTDYNNAVKDYNSRLVSIPNAWFAGMFGFEPEPYFEATPESQVPPVVDFGS